MFTYEWIHDISNGIIIGIIHIINIIVLRLSLYILGVHGMLRQLSLKIPPTSRAAYVSPSSRT